MANQNTTVKFGAVSSPTPLWSKWMFRGWSIFTTAVAFYVAGTSLLSAQSKTEILLAAKSSDMLVLGLSKMFGIVKK